MKAYISDTFITTVGGVSQSVISGARSSGSTKNWNGADGTVAVQVYNPCVTFYKGTIPTASEIEAFDFNSSRTSDKLVHLSAPNIAETFSYSGKSIIINTGVANVAHASQNGTIGWVRIGNTEAVTSDPLTHSPAVFGTVGLPGSGADVELAKVTTTTGESWICTDLRFDISNELTFIG